MSNVKEILVESFQFDKTVQDIVKQHNKKEERLELLIDYFSFYEKYGLKKGVNFKRLVGYGLRMYRYKDEEPI